MRPDSFGIELDGLSILDLHPPFEVVADYYEVAKAMEERDRRINDAEKDALKKTKAAESEHTRIVAQARAAATEKIAQASADTSRFLALAEGRNSLDAEQDLRLRLDAVEDALRGTPPSLVEAEYRKRRQSLLAVQAALTDFRLYWDGVSRALTGRDLVLIDADKIAGRRNFLLFDPELFRMPVPMFLPQAGRAAPRPADDGR